MHHVNIQVQPDLLATFDEQAITCLKALASPEGSVLGVSVSRGDDSGPYINVLFSTPDPQLLWPSVREELVRLGLQGASIVTCTGSLGWENYVLLHNFGASVRRARPDAA